MAQQTDQQPTQEPSNPLILVLREQRDGAMNAAAILKARVMVLEQENQAMSLELTTFRNAAKDADEPEEVDAPEDPEHAGLGEDA